MFLLRGERFISQGQVLSVILLDAERLKHFPPMASLSATASYPWPQYHQTEYSRSIRISWPPDFMSSALRVFAELGTTGTAFLLLLHVALLGHPRVAWALSAAVLQRELLLSHISLTAPTSRATAFWKSVPSFEVIQPALFVASGLLCLH